jgi:hypothetical protein
MTFFKKALKYLGIISILLAAIAVAIVLYPMPPSNSLLTELNLELGRHSKEVENKDYAILVDYRLPVLMKRLWVVNMKTGEDVLTCHVAHAYKSGRVWPTVFSNTIGSNISSKGAFVTSNDYNWGNYGHSMKINGLEKQNNNVFKRTIVFHPAARYFYGIKLPIWTNGCFATTEENMEKIISLTKGGRFCYVKK